MILKLVSWSLSVDRLAGFKMDYRVYGKHGLMGTLDWSLVNIVLYYKHVFFNFLSVILSFFFYFIRLTSILIRNTPFSWQIHLLWLVMTKQSRNRFVVTDCPYLFSSWIFHCIPFTLNSWHKLQNRCMKFPLTFWITSVKFQNHFSVFRKFYNVLCSFLFLKSS